MLHPVAFVLDWAIWALLAILWAYFIVSLLEFWQRSSRTAPRFNLHNPVVHWIQSVAYTMLHPVRRVIDPYQRNSPIDFSLIIVFIALQIAQQWIRMLPF